MYKFGFCFTYVYHVFILYWFIDRLEGGNTLEHIACVCKITPPAARKVHLSIEYIEMICLQMRKYKHERCSFSRNKISNSCSLGRVQPGSHYKTI